MKIKLKLTIILSLFFHLTPFNAQAAWGCPSAKVKPGKTTSGCIKVAKLKREYRLHIPKNQHKTNQSLPLVIGLHGGGGKPKRFEDYSKLNNAFKKHVTVYPKGIQKHWNDGRDNVNSNIDDVQFLNQLVAHIKNDLSLNIDDQKVFIIGMSNGGLMAYRMACEQPDWLSGIGVVAASMTDEINALCLSKTKLKPLKIAIVFGDKDTSFLSNGKQVNPIKPKQQRGSHIGIDKTLNFWIKNNGCTNKGDKKILNADPKDKTKIIKSTAQQCHKAVVYYDVKNGGHRWPNRESKNGKFLVKRLNIGLASQDMNTAEELLSELL